LRTDVVRWVFTAGEKSMAKSANKVAAWDFNRIVVCHRNVVETGGKEAFTRVFAARITCSAWRRRRPAWYFGVVFIIEF
jgi:hypothetical protein